MTQDKAKKLFPKCFPENIVQTICEIGHKEDIEVYRICRQGKIDKQAFISTYEEYILGLINLRDGVDKNEVGTFSTSVFENKKDVQRTYKLLSRHHPKAIIVQLITRKQYGLLQKTKERIPSAKNSHIDWWIYDGVNPHEDDSLKEVQKNELS